MKKYVLLIIAIFLINNCASLKVNNGSINEMKNTNNYDFSSINIVYCIDTDTENRNYDAEEIAKNAIKTVFENNKSEYKFLILPKNDSDESCKILLNNFFNSLKLDEIENSEIPDSIMQMPHGTNENLILIRHSGFYRSEQNVKSATTKSLIIGILTLGMFVPIPIEAKSSFEYCIINLRVKKVLVYNRLLEQSDPKSEDTVKKHMQNMTEDLNKIRGIRKQI